MSIESDLILCRPLLLLPPIPPSIRVFSNESILHMRWPKYWSFSFNIIPSKEIPGLISFRMDWLDLLAVQGSLKSLLQHDSSKASILHTLTNGTRGLALSPSQLPPCLPHCVQSLLACRDEQAEHTGFLVLPLMKLVECTARTVDHNVSIDLGS